MKKFLAILISTLMMLSMCFITGCNNTDENHSSTKAKVELIGIQGSIYNADDEYEKEKISKLSVATLSLNTADVEVEEPTTGDDVLLPGKEEASSESSSEKNLLDGTDYIVIYKNQTIINFTIKLSNPEDYYIMDFSLDAENEDVEYLTTEGTWKSIKDRTIRWMSSDNETCTYHLRLLNENATPSKIKILSMYYSDRKDGTNKTAVNLNNKETYTIYKVDSAVEKNIVTAKNIKNTLRCEEVEFELEIGANVTIDKIYTFDIIYPFEAVEVKPENNIYKVKANNNFYIDYTYHVSDNIILKGTKTFWANPLEIFYKDTKNIAPIVKSMKIGADEKYYNYYCLSNIQIAGFGRPEDYWETNEYAKTTLLNSDSEVYIAWKEEKIFIKIPEGKNDKWCEEQSFVLFGQEFVVSYLIDRMYY